MKSIEIGTLVLIVRTASPLDGLTGTVTTGLVQSRGVDFAGYLGIVHGYTVELARPIPWGDTFRVVPECLVPLQPPGPREEVVREAPLDLVPA